MIKNIRVGIPIIGAQSWSGGITYIELLVKAVRHLPTDERPQMFFVITDYTVDRFDLHQSFAHLFNGIFFLGQDIEKATRIIRSPFDHLTSYQMLFEKIDFYFPVLVSALPSNMCSASWIPDFQYVHLPQFFSQEESQDRAASAKKVAEEATLVVLSSNDVKKDFQNQFPNSKAITRILSFHSLSDDECYKKDAAEVQKKYNLPDHFLICCNQFWMHKNHILLFEALSKLLKSGTKVHLVCTGATEDHRSIGYFSQIQKIIIDLGIQDIIHILGYIPRNDQVQLIRRSIALVQPSLFEGWGTVVEDSRQFGKTIILSDLPVHYEQNPEYGVYFNRNNSDELAQVIYRLLPALTPGPDIERENEAKIKSEKLVEDYARQFCAITVESQFIFNKKIRNVSNNLWNLLIEPLSANQLDYLIKERNSISEAWLRLPPDQLEKAYTGDMGNVHRKLMDGNLRNEKLTHEENAFLQHVIAELTKRSGTDPVSAINYLLAAMLYLPSDRLKIENARTSLPGWLIGDYEKFFCGG